MAAKTNNQYSSNLRKFFQIHAFPAVKVSQSHFMTVDGKAYAIVGQHVLRSPVFSHFDVLDHTGQRADDQTAETVYAHVSMLQLTTYIEQMKDKIQQSSVNERKPNNKRWMDEDIGELTRLKFKAEYGEDLNDVQRENERMLTLLQELTMQSERVSKLDHWIVDDFQDFYRAWNAFWKAYQQRMALLFKFREFLMEKNIDEEGMTGSGLRQVYLEANAMHQLFAQSIPVSIPFITDVDDWILFMAQLGRVHPDNKRDPGVKPFWRFLYRFFKQTYKLILWFIFPVSIILAIAELLSSDDLLLVGSFLLAFFLAYIMDKSILESGARKRSQQQRKDRLGTQSIIQRKYQQAFSLLK